MKAIVEGIIRAVPVLLERSTFQISLHGWPAATAVVALSATIVATLIVRSDNHASRPAE